MPRLKGKNFPHVAVSAPGVFYTSASPLLTSLSGTMVGEAEFDWGGTGFVSAETFKIAEDRIQELEMVIEMMEEREALDE